MICLSIGIINHAEPAGTSGSRSWRCVGWDRYVCAVEGFDDKYECLGLWGKTGSIFGITHVCVHVLSLAELHLGLLLMCVN